MTEPIKGTTSDYRLFKRSIRFSVTVLILLIIAFSAWKSVSEYRLTVHSAEMLTQGYASALKEHAERALNESDTALLDIIENFQEHGNIATRSENDLKKLLAHYTRNSPQIASIILINPDGLLFAHSLDTPLKQANVADRDYFIHHRDNPSDTTPFLSKPFKSRINGKWRITLSRSIRTKQGEFAGIVAVALELDYFRKFYSSLNLGTKGKIVLVRRDGTFLLAAPYKESDFSSDFKKSHLMLKYLPRAPKGTFHIAGGKALIESNARIISYDSLESFPVVANANVGKDEILTSWRKTSIIQAILVVIVSLTLWSLAHVLLRQIRRIEDAHRIQLDQQRELTASSEVWHSTFDAVEDAVWVMDLDHKIIRSNRASDQMFKITKEEIIGQLCYTIAHNTSSPIDKCPFQRMMDTGHRASMQVKIEGRWYDVSVDPIRSDAGAITGAVHIVSDITDIKQAEEQALENETRIRALLAAIPDAIFFKDDVGRWLLVNEAGIALFRLQNVEYLGKTDYELAEIIPERRDALLNCQQSDRTAWENHGMSRFEETIADENGQTYIFDTIKIPLYKADGNRHGLLVLERDITEQKLMEMQLRQAQKMEAIGHLAGGIAHDFNNLLTPILGYSEMIAARLHASDPLNSKIAGISAAAHKAKDLTQQLLTFGRPQPLATNVIDLNEVIDSFYIVLRRTIRESISIKLALDPDGSYVSADRSQMEQIILNMTVNAQDALCGKGIIAIETCRVIMEGENARLHPGMTEGQYALLTFRDTGCGMSSDVLAHIFEPFFTTKPVGHGTGLGLATVYGIVKQHNGHISVTSRENEGTTFRIYLPATNVVPLMQPDENVVVTTITDQTGVTVLLVEDNEMVREMVKEMLEGYGYSVLAASDSNQAIEIAARYKDTISVMVSDVVMPGMSGPELYEQLVVQMTGLRVVYISGYPMNPSIRQGTLEEGVNYLQKPFTAEALMERIRQVFMQ